ncbi:MAG: hypothetical protein AAGB02_08650 [Pseudomonadota bacterium]
MKILIAFALVFVAACSGPNGSQSNASAPAAPVIEGEQGEARIAAVLSYADWCSSCKILDPKLTAVKAGAAIPGVQYVTIDYTDKNADSFFAGADAAGVGPAVREKFDGEVKTGLLLIVNLETGQLVDTLTKTVSEEELRAALENAAAV